MLGYGWAGLFRKYLVDSPYMWWPSNLVQVSLFRYIILHIEKLFAEEKEVFPKVRNIVKCWVLIPCIEPSYM
jgi:hypothetical protein